MKTTNLLQAYLNNNPTAQQYNSDKVARDFDVHRELSNRTFIKPLPSNGKLVRYTLMDYPSEIQKDIKYDAKAIYHAIKGEANDHELGRINDVAMKFGGLALAAYLFTKKSTPKTKLFEFIGLGTFFAAMDIWPKLLIQLPAKLIHGVNVRQEYEDSYGRKKMFYQDHQFIPWDLYPDDEINAIGDRLHVPKDIPNRRNFIQEKMRKIALQNNTLWMLTAGFATPLMSALMCNLLDKPVAHFTDKATNNKVNKLITNFSKEVKKVDLSKQQEAFKKLLADNKGKTITPELFDKIATGLADGLDETVAVGIREDLEQLLPVNSEYKISDESAGNLQKSIEKVFRNTGLPDDVTGRVIPDAGTIADRFAQKGLNGTFGEFSEHSKVLQGLLEENIGKVSSELDEKSVRKLNLALSKLIHSKTGIHEDAPIFKTLKFEPANLLTENRISRINSLADILDSHKPEEFVLNKTAYLKVGQDAETALANIWNNTDSGIFKSLKFTDKEIKDARLDNEIAEKILREKIENLVADKKAYSDFVNQMKTLLSSIHKNTMNLDMTAENDTTANSFKSLVDATYDRTANKLVGEGFEHTAEKIGGIVGHNKQIVAPNGSAKQMLIEAINYRVMGVKASFYRFLNCVDMYYRIANLKEDDPILHRGLKREIKEEMVELAKRTMIGGHTSDFAEKLQQKRNPVPNADDYGQVQISGGKVVNRYLGKYEHEAVNYANDRRFYDGVMRFMFSEGIHEDTRKMLEQEGFFKEFLEYRDKWLVENGDFECIGKHNFTINENPVKTPSIRMFTRNGCPPAEMAFKWFNNNFNSRTWFKMFGKLGAGLVGVTLLAQFFIGRMKAPEATKGAKQ